MELSKHPTEDTLEQYLFGILPEQEIDCVEEHLLVCHSCIDTAEQLLAFMQSLRNTLDDGAQKTLTAGRGSVSQR